MKKRKRCNDNKNAKIVLLFFVINAITNIPRAKIGLFINAKPNIKPDRIGKSIFSFSDLKYRTSKAREKISDIPKINILFIAFEVK